MSIRNDNNEEQVKVCESGVAVNVFGDSGYLSFDEGTQFNVIISTYYINDGKGMLLLAVATFFSFLFNVQLIT